MRAHSTGLLAAAAMLMLAGCGGQATPADAAPPSHVEPAATSPNGGITIQRSGTTTGPMKWFVRIETASSQTIVEAEFPAGAGAVQHTLPAGRYRVLSWGRPCESGCPATGEAGLGPLAEVCGTLVTVATGKQQAVVVQTQEDGSCTVRLDG